MKKKIDPRAPTEIDAHVGIRLKLRRLILGMSQRDLARVSNIAYQQLQDYERGTNRMSVSRLFQLGRLLRVPISWFFEGLTEDGKPQRGNDDWQVLLDDPTAGKLVLLYEHVRDPDVRRQIRDLARLMADHK